MPTATTHILTKGQAKQAAKMRRDRPGRNGFRDSHRCDVVVIEGASTKGIARVRVSDFALVCSKCHRMLHRLRPMMSAQELKRHLATMATER